MAHRLLVPPIRRLEPRIRLPLVQHPGERIVDNLVTTLMDRDSLRRVKTTGQHKATGPLPAVQIFTHEHVGGPNSPENMRAGIRISMGQNAGSGKTAGM